MQNENNSQTQIKSDETVTTQSQIVGSGDSIRPTPETTRTTSTWKVLFWALGLAVALPALVSIVFSLVAVAANDSSYLYLLLMATPLLVLSGIAEPALLVTLILYLVRVKPQGMRRTVTIGALIILSLWMLWGAMGYLRNFLENLYAY